MAPAAPKILVHGHRGARAVRPENTMPAFEYAIAAGVDFLELDMAVTRDNVVVVSHDPYLEPPVCSGPRPKATIRDLTFDEVRQWDCGKLRNPAFPGQMLVPGTRVPSLDEVFALAPRGEFKFSIEAKSFLDRPELAPPPQEFVRLVLAVIRKHRLERRVLLQSFDFRALHAMKELAPEISGGALWEDDDGDFVSIAHAANTDIVSPAYKLATPHKVRAAHEAGLQVIPWTANTPADWDMLIAAQVDGIVTDDPAALIAYLKNKGLR